MKMVDVSKRQKPMQRGIDGGRNAISAEGAERIHLHHLVFVRHAAIAISQRKQLVKVEGGETAALYAPQVAAASFHPQDRRCGAVQRIFFYNLGAGIAASEVGDAQIGSEQVGTVA